MARKFEKGSEEWQMFTDFWAMCQKVWDCDFSYATDELVWEQYSAFLEKHTSDFAHDLAYAIESETARQRRRNRMRLEDQGVDPFALYDKSKEEWKAAHKG